MNLDLDDEKTRNLQKLGLTSQQAKIFLVLVEVGKAKTLTISKIANVDRSNAYRTIQRLQRMGLVIKTLDTPNLYKAIPMEDAVSTLISYQKDKYDKMVESAQKLMQISSANDAQPQKKEYTFEIINRKKETMLKSIIQSCRTVQKSFDLIVNKFTFCEGVIGLANEQLRCINRGIKYRMITEKINTKPFQGIFHSFMEKPNFHLRYTLNAPRAELVICDKKFATVTLLPNSRIGDPMLITDHLGCVEMFRIYFDKVWNKASEYKLPNKNPTR